MLKLIDGTLLYHSSFTTVSKIQLEKCKQGKDFDHGFYVTSSYAQARSFMPLSINKQINNGNLPSGYSTDHVSIATSKKNYAQLLPCVLCLKITQMKPELLLKKPYSSLLLLPHM